MRSLSFNNDNNKVLTNIINYKINIKYVMQALFYINCISITIIKILKYILIHNLFIKNFIHKLIKIYINFSLNFITLNNINKFTF